jgi:peptidoglycan/LPS O-acetylase OafA/YrhL
MTAATGRTEGQEAAAAPDAFKPPPGHPRFPLFDGLRAIAALAVLLTHAGNLSGFSIDNTLGGAITERMNVGVSIFFVISGFLLYRPFVAARFEGRPRPRVGRYFRRRALRILPAYWFALTVAALVFNDVVHDVFTGNWWIYYGFLQNTSHSYIFGGLIVAWSLCVELGFYLVLPLYVLLAERTTRALDRPSAVFFELSLLGAFATASVVARTVMYETNPDTSFSEMLPGTLLWFCLGMGMAVLSASHSRAAVVRFVERHAGLTWLAAAGVFAIAASAGWPRSFQARHTTGQWLAEHVLFGIVSALLVAPAVFGASQRSVPARILGLRVVQWLGLISYGIFLWHVPIGAQIEGLADEFPNGGFVIYLAALVAASCAAAAFSYYVIERPLLRFKEGRPRRASG